MSLSNFVFTISLFISALIPVITPANSFAEETERKIANVVDLESEIQSLKSQIENQNLDGAGCAKLMGEAYQRLWNSTPADYAANASARAELKKKAPQLIQSLFETKIILRKRIAELNSKGQATLECTNAARSLLRAGRFLEDILGQLQLDFPVDDPKVRPPVLAGKAPFMLHNPSAGKFALKSGDILISRGNAFTSAAIARVAEVDAQFSHAAVIYIDEKTGVKETIESHIEIGTIVAPLEKYLTDGKTRSVVFRHRDPVLAHNAAKAVKKAILDHKARTKQNYPYDFKLDENNHGEVFCSELVRFAFELASQGKEKIPEILSRVNPKNPKFVNRLGMQLGDTFLPGDLELDGRFELIAEWRDYGRVEESHIHDSLLTSLYSWMDRYGYEMHDSGWTKIKSKVVWNLRRWPLFSKLLDEKFPLNMSKTVIATVTTLDRVAAILHDQLEKANAAQMRKTGAPLTPKEMEESLESYRIADLALWKSKRSSAVLHHILRPPTK